MSALFPSLIAAAQMIIVTGGGGSSVPYLASTEVYAYPDGDVWTAVADLPSSRAYFSGVSRSDGFYVAGGRRGGTEMDEVAFYDPLSNTFTIVGHLTTTYWTHAVTEVPWQAVAQYCSTTTVQPNIPKL